MKRNLFCTVYRGSEFNANHSVLVSFIQMVDLHDLRWSLPWLMLPDDAGDLGSAERLSFLRPIKDNISALALRAPDMKMPCNPKCSGSGDMVGAQYEISKLFSELFSSTF